MLLLDYDCTPLIDPTALFEGPHMALHGNLFWPDLPDGGETRPAIKQAAEALGLNSKEALVRDACLVPACICSMQYAYCCHEGCMPKFQPAYRLSRGALTASAYMLVW